MAIKFKCDCGKALSARVVHAGKKVRCPECGRKVRVPEPESVAGGTEAAKARSGGSLEKLEAELLVGENEKIAYSAKPGIGVLVLRMVLFNIAYIAFVLAPLIVLPQLLADMGRYLPGRTVTHMILVAVALIVAVILNSLLWLAWQRTVYVLTPNCIVAQRGVFFSTVERMPLDKITMVRQLRFGRGLVFYGS
ncbi:MAG: PH domain-containing protein [Planctomycetes bacterium]|nr:PH domain-containing protein [Planctomycetota bacterium]